MKSVDLGDEEEQSWVVIPILQGDCFQGPNSNDLILIGLGIVV